MTESKKIADALVKMLRKYDSFNLMIHDENCVYLIDYNKIPIDKMDLWANTGLYNENYDLYIDLDDHSTLSLNFDDEKEDHRFDMTQNENEIVIKSPALKIEYEFKFLNS